MQLDDNFIIAFHDQSDVWSETTNVNDGDGTVAPPSNVATSQMSYQNMKVLCEHGTIPPFTSRTVQLPRRLTPFNQIAQRLRSLIYKLKTS